MFKSLKSWINIPFTFKPYISRNATGAKQFGTSVSALCYPTGSIKVVKNDQGKEIVSTKQLYVDGTCPIKELDNVVFEGVETEIVAINYFYYNGSVDLKVVYL